MGFGVLFCGYFLLLNFINYAFTDVVAALVMLYALYKLSRINQGFRLAAVSSAIFSGFGLLELCFALLEVLSIFKLAGTAAWVLAIARHFIVAATTALMLMGMRDVAREVDITSLAAKCNYLSYVTVAVYSVNILLEASELASFLDGQLLVTLYVISIVATLALVITNLTSIFSCYYKICMPEDNTPEFTEKKSRLEFVNKFRAHEDEKQREYADYKLEKFKKRVEKSKAKNKDKK